MFKFGSLAVIRGWIKQSTLDFFLNYLFPQAKSKSPFVERHATADLKSQQIGDKNTRVLYGEDGEALTAGNVKFPEHANPHVVWID